MSILNNIYQSLKQTIMPRTKTQKLTILPTDADGWKKFLRKNKVTKPFFQIDGVTRRTSDLKTYSSVEEFAADGGKWSQIQKVKAK